MEMFWETINDYGLLVILMVIVLFAGLVSLLLARKNRITMRDKMYIQNKWDRLSDFAVITPRTAILEADKLLDYSLGKLGYGGTLGEKLRKSEGLFRNIDNVWRAHKVRNKIAHDLDFDITKKEASAVIRIFKNALQDVGGL